METLVFFGYFFAALFAVLWIEERWRFFLLQEEYRDFLIKTVNLLNKISDEPTKAANDEEQT